MTDAASEVPAALPGAFERAQHGKQQVVVVAGTAIGKLLLGQLPDAFVGVELRGIGGKALEPEPLDATTEVSNQATLVRTATVPQDDDAVAQVL